MVGTIAFIGVTYATDETAVAFARQLEPFCREHDVIAVLVDNGPQSGKAELESLIRNVNPRMHYLNFGDNLGYFGGADSAWRWIVSRFGAPRWAIVSNVDVDFGGNGFVRHLREYENLSEVGVLAPAIISARSGVDQNPHFVSRPAARRMHFYRVVFGRYWFRELYEAASALLRRLKPSRTSAAAARDRVSRNGDEETLQGLEIYAPHGSCMLFSRDYFDAGASLRYPSFLFGEEIFVAESCRRRGLKVVYTPSLRITHQEHMSTRAIPRKEIAAYAAASAAYLAREFFDGQD